MSARGQGNLFFGPENGTRMDGMHKPIWLGGRSGRSMSDTQFGDNNSPRISGADEWGSQRSLTPQCQLGESMLMLWLLRLRFQKPAKALGAGREL